MWNTVKQYATQPSTYKGILSLLASIGLLKLSPEVQDSLVSSIGLVVGGVIGLVGVYDVAKNEKK